MSTPVVGNIAFQRQVDEFYANVRLLAEEARRLPDWQRGPVGAGLYPQEYPEAMRRFRKREKQRIEKEARDMTRFDPCI